MSEADYFIDPPGIPEADEEVIWFDTGEGGHQSLVGLIGDMLFDQPVTLVIRTAARGQELDDMSSEEIPANTPTPLAVKFLGYRTQIALVVGSTPPELWHTNARLTEGEV